MDTTRTATAPHANVTVMASAGTGKTWLLITRLIRLLMNGVNPDAILAVTFTRKAAAEMQSRLRERLYDYLTMDDEQLTASLTLIGLDIDDDNPLRIRHLFEDLMRNEQSVRITTYHAFCQDILHHFPFDAGVPPGFDVVENAGLLTREAWDALISETTTHHSSTVARALKTLLEYHGGIDGPRQALETFLNHRVDWWAYTLGQKDPVSYATKALTRQLDIDPQTEPGLTFLGGNTLPMLDEFIHLLDLHQTNTNQKHIVRLRRACEPSFSLIERLQHIRSVFLTQKNEPVARKETKAQLKSMGESGQQRFLQIHEIICAELALLREQENRLLTLRINQAWYRAGAEFLSHTMRIKTERRQLDFSDLEWHTYLLLHHSDQALWVQYKLDHRIDHFLVDEFQDTNPTQWAILLPLLEELAASDHEQQRSVFLVGDSKQSIYRFRRANPHLFDAANDWMKVHLKVENCTLDTSRRSAPTIIDFVNSIFMNGDFKSRLPNFHCHSTHHENLWGRVEILPLIIKEKRLAVEEHTETQHELRNPLMAPRPDDSDDLHFAEGELIAEHISKIISSKTLLTTHDKVHQVGYSDITILVRSRTHIHHYEKALRNASIPYRGGGRTTLLDCLEIQDMVTLLELLLAPYNNLSLACVLRSPLFACSDDDLIFLAERSQQTSVGTASWFDTLCSHQHEIADNTPLKRAWNLLNDWRNLAGQLPVHDLLDRIYCDANVLQCYQSAFPASLRSRARGNLIRFIEIALEVDSGRYPSLPHFLARIRALHQYDQNALEEAPHLDQQDAVRIMTIHAAKGLESPIVFLADSARPRKRPSAYQLLADWPSESSKPDSFLIGAKTSELDSWSLHLRDQADAEDLIEETNLLYVALTRTRQWLIISGCMPKRGNDHGWYGDIVAALGIEENISLDGFEIESGQMPTQLPHPDDNKDREEEVLDPRLSQQIPTAPVPQEVTPSTLQSEVQEEKWRKPILVDDGIVVNEGFNRGIVIHRMLDLLTRNPGQVTGETREGRARLYQAIANDFSVDPQDPTFQACWQEALTVVDNSEFSMLFNKTFYQQATNEVPLVYEQDGQIVNGVIDRLVIADTLTLIDYKTHLNATPDNLALLAAPYQRQMQYYYQGVRKLWPDKKLRVLLLFTACTASYELTFTETKHNH